MFADLREFEEGSHIEADLCIIGAGAASLTLARRFLGTHHRVCVLESGGTAFEQEVQELNEGLNEGMPYYELDHARLRLLGGTMNIWGGRCAPLDEDDFKSRSWVPYSGWPITLADLQPYYREAEKILSLQECAYGPEVWDLLGRARPPFDPEVVQTEFWQFAPFSKLYKVTGCDDLREASNIEVVLHATATNIRPAENAARVTGIEVKTPEGKEAVVTARAYVLACGGIENARLLLASRDVEANGVGNRHDLVGRFFMEHPHGRAAQIHSRQAGLLCRMFRKERFGNVMFGPTLRPSGTLQERQGLLNTSLTLKYQPWPERGLQPHKALYHKVKYHKDPDPLGLYLHRGMKRLNASLAPLIDHYIRPLQLALNRGGVFLIARAEQAPNPASRVRLAREVDKLGMPRSVLDWRLSRQDKESVAGLCRAFDGELKRLRLGRAVLNDWVLDETADWPVDETVSNHPIGGFHHMGTTRMAEDPKRGVVDADCRVHGYGNLYIAGSSVFATSGWANPTLTILALAIRLADMLKEHIQA